MRRLSWLVGLGGLLLSSACLFNFERAAGLEPGDIEGRVVGADGQAVPWAKVRVANTGLLYTADGEGRFVVRGLSAGAYTLRFSDDENGDGLIERAATRTAAINIETHADGLFGQGERRPSFVLLGDVPLEGVVTVRGSVRNDAGDAMPAAEVFIVRTSELPPAVVDADGTQREGLEVQLNVEARTGTRADGSFFFPAVAAGSFSLVARLIDDDGVQYVSAPLDAVASPDEDLVLGDPLVVLPPPPTERDAQVELAPAPSPADRVQLVLAEPGTNTADEALFVYGDGDPLEAAGASSFNVRIPIGVWSTFVGTESGARANLGVHVASRPGTPLVILGLGLLDDLNECFGGEGVIDCDHDGLQALPPEDEASDAVRTACGQACADAFGSAAADASCEADGETYDCDDDGDGQPDVTEPDACRGVNAGGDQDGDGVCEAADLFDDCASDDPADDACGTDRAGLERPPLGTGWGGPTLDAGPDPTDAGDTDAGPADAGEEDAGAADAGPGDDAGVDAGPLLDLPAPGFAFQSNGAGWARWVKNDGATLLSATDTPCVGDELGAWDRCVNGGLVKVVDVTGESSCAGLTADDDLRALEWRCDDASGTARVYSRGFHPDKGLTDLVDFSGPSWRDVTVTVRRDGAPIATTAPAPWDDAPFAAITTPISSGQGAPGDIFVATSMDGQHTIDVEGVTLLVEPGETLAATGAPFGVVFAQADFFHFEGELSSAGTSGFVGDTSIAFPTVRRTRCSNLNSCVSATSNVGGLFEGIEAVSIANTALFLGGYGLLARHIRVTSAVSTAMSVGGERNVVSDAWLVNNGGSGLSGSGCIRCLFERVRTANNGFNGIQSRSVTSVFVDVISAFNFEDGYGYASGSDTRNVLMDIGFVGNEGVDFQPRSDVLQRLYMMGHETGLRLWGNSTDTDVRDVLFANNGGYGIQEQAGLLPKNRFAGHFAVGGNSLDCQEGFANPSIVEGRCTLTGRAFSSRFNNPDADDAELHTDVDMRATLVGRVLTDDVANQSDSDGGGLANLGDWFDFDNPYRVWGLDAAPGAVAMHKGRCDGAEPCRIWDFRLSTLDFGDPNGGGAGVPGPVALGVLDPPTGDDTLSMRWRASPQNPFIDQASCDLHAPGSTWDSQSSECVTDYLVRARELLFDDDGNDNGLCESGEACLYTPNIGPYQGHGALVPGPAFVDGVVTGVTLYRYVNNGVRPTANSEGFATVEPLYPNNGAAWNDYVNNDGADSLSASDVPCDDSVPGRYYDTCVHGGERRVVDLSASPVGGCGEATIWDELGVFDWTCSAVGGFRAISRGLKPHAGLTDLIDFTTLEWKQNRVLVAANGELVAATEPAIWWTNPVGKDNDGIASGEAVAGQVTVVSGEMTLPETYLIDVDGAILVVDPAAPVSAILGTATNTSGAVLGGAFEIDGASGVWLEGSFRDDDGESSDSPPLPFVSVANGRRNVVNRVHVMDLLNDTPVYVDGTAQETLVRALAVESVLRAGQYAVEDGGTRTIVRDVYSEGASVYGYGDQTLMVGAYATNVDSFGMEQAGTNTVTQDLFVRNASGSGVSVRDSHGVWSRVHGSSTSRETIDGTSASHSTLHAVTAALGDGGYCVWFRGADRVAFNDALIVGCEYGLLVDANLVGFRAENLAVLNNELDGITSYVGDGDAEYHGVLRVSGNGGSACRVSVVAGTSGLIEPTCTATGAAGTTDYGAEASTATFYPNVTASEAVVGAVDFDDGRNPEDLDGLTESTGLEFLSVAGRSAFESPHRGWGNDGTLFGTSGNWCLFSTCRIWDWTLREGETADADAGAALLGVVPVPTGDDVAEHRWYSASAPTVPGDCTPIYGSSFAAADGGYCFTTYLKHAWEIPLDEVGNDNGLCESNEACVHVQNIGAYQGEGPLVPVAFTDGTVTGVSLYRYSLNGR